MLRLLFYFLFFYIVWRIVRAVVGMLVGPPAKRNIGRSPRRHAADFSDVQDADFEDITPPRDQKRDSSTSSTP